MIVFRNAVQVVICDGCYSVISKPGSGPWPSRTDRFTAWRTADGRNGNVCSAKCGAKFEADKPSSQERVA
jgi:hypothetical protein